MSTIFFDIETVRVKGISIGVPEMVFVFENTERSVIISVIQLRKRDGTYTTPSRNDSFYLRHLLHDLSGSQMIDTMASENRGFMTETWLGWPRSEARNAHLFLHIDCGLTTHTTDLSR
jgi:hypothetical protein